ncbi:MAG TPA: YdcF family protein [Paenibacillus sp.]|nr:YdcF family protein [Paenibacillus sp.]HZG84180.1 YdcF family protein [Paenibacillus sp.]
MVTISSVNKGANEIIYVVKFIYSFILPPGIFIVLLLIGAWRLRNREKAVSSFLLLVTFLFYLSSTGFIGNLLVGSLENKYAPPQVVSGDVIVVLGGGATRRTPDVDGEGNLSGPAANRIITAARIHSKTGYPIILSGGQVFEDTGNEAEIAERQLISLGVPPERIIVENRSVNTEQNAEYVSDILRSRSFKKPILVTSAFHMERAVIHFGNAGIQVTPYPTDYHVSKGTTPHLHSFTPTNLDKTSLALKEYLGIFAARFLKGGAAYAPYRGHTFYKVWRDVSWQGD